VSYDLWEKVQLVLGNKSFQKPGKTKYEYAFSRLITCGHCGGLLVAEKKKRKYVYYHCTRYKGKCPEPYVREEILTKKFDEVVKRINLDKTTKKIMVDALRQSHEDTKAYHEANLDRLQKDYDRLQNRIDRAYEDKLDGKITSDFFERKSAEWNSEQTRLLRRIEEHQQAKKNYLEEGIILLELASEAYQLYMKRTPAKKRQFLDFLLSNSIWKDGELKVTYRKPFDILEEMTTEQKKKKAAGSVSSGLSPVQRGGRDSKVKERETKMTNEIAALDPNLLKSLAFAFYDSLVLNPSRALLDLLRESPGAQ
jgi:site-specific DNA recombinase